MRPPLCGSGHVLKHNRSRNEESEMKTKKNLTEEKRNRIGNYEKKTANSILEDAGLRETRFANAMRIVPLFCDAKMGEIKQFGLQVADLSW